MAFNPRHYRPPQAKNTPFVQQWNQPQLVQTGYVEPFQPGYTTKPHPSRPDNVKSNQPVYNQYDAFQSGYVQSFPPSPGCVQPTHASEHTALSIGPGRKHLHIQNIQRGKISELNEGYGFLSSTSIKDEAQSQSIYFKFNNDSNTEIGLIDLQVGDILEFNLNSSSERQWATNARLLKCSQRSPEVLTIYMNKLLQENPGKVLREVTKIPAGLILVLETKRQSLNLISLVLKLANRVSTHEAASLYKARLKQFYKLFCGTAFLRDPDGLHGYISEICICDNKDEEENGRLLFKQFCFQLTEYCKDLVADLLAVLRVIVKSRKEDNAPSTSQFLLEMFSVLTGGAVDYSQEFYWTRVPLHPLDSEINNTIEMDKSRKMSSLKLLPCVIKKGSYGSTEVYLDTYFRLLTEDCFAKLKSGISALKSNQLDPRDMRVWIEGSVLGIHFGTGYSGISVAIKTEKRGRKVHSRSDMPMTGNLLCISDDGGNFESPIWGIVTGCEEENNKVIIFTEILDEGDEVGVQSISRLLGASNIVLAESPTYYKAYQPVLKSLQQMDLEKLPFKDELVDAAWPNKAPDYLNSSTTLNWSCLFDDKSLRRNFFELDDSHDSNLGSDMIASKYITAQKNTIFGVHGCDFGCKTSLTRNISELNTLLSSGYKPILDQSQLGAVNLALNNRLVLIQGPPGTGKTYVGVRILELLLTANSLPSGPVVVITYKNHSLDQFLISCLRFCGNKKTDDLVRLGGRTTDPLLDKYNMSIHLNEGNIFNSDCKHNKSKLNVVRSEMENLSQELKESNVFHMKAILHRMPDKQLRQLPNTRYNINLVRQVPVEVPIMDYIENQKGESRHLLAQIFQALSQSLMWWMPSRETFELVKEILSMEKQPQNFEMAYDINIDGENTVENLEDIEDENEEKAELGICMAETRGGRKQWLEENFLRFTTDDNSNPFGGVKRLNNVDLKEYGWVMHENPWHLKASHRAIMIYLILQLNHEEVLRRFGDAKKQYDELVEDMKEITKRRQLDVLMNAKIVGMTTTGAAMHQDILKMLAPPIIMVEEAAEVLEPQLLAAIGPSLQHLILIGDHYQLPPPVESYKLKLRHGLGVSMFERLIEYNKLPHQTLSVQSRMHEELLPLILPIYPDLQSNVKLVSGERNKEPKCMLKRMHFWCHAYKENRERSFQNEWEAKMVIALAQWMVAEGHAPTEITILAAYNGQVSLLREKIAGVPSIQTIQIHTIDRFQGSENQIIIVSLVRSNMEGRIGHLAERNRLCVSVSRARSGLYLCGNDVTLAKSDDWKILLNHFKEQECIGNLIYLCCPRHPHNPPLTVDSQEVDSFNISLCKVPCSVPLACGHKCQSSCHHGIHPSCSEKVELVLKSCGHQITKKCSEDEETLQCQQEITFKFPECPHIKLCKCWEKKTRLKCEEICGRLRKCGHQCTLMCSQKCEQHECGDCREIAKVQADIEKNQAILQIKLKKEELEAEIRRLKMQKNQTLICKELSEEGDTAAEYLQVMDRTERFIQPSHGICPIVTKIEKISNLEMEIKFLESQKDLFNPNGPRQLLFHGTDDAAIKSIISKGFKLPPKGNDNMFGRGCYFATDSTKSAQKMYTKGSNKLLLCEVNLGNTWTVQEPCKDMDLDKIKEKRYDSLFSKRKGNATGGTLYDEFVIYDVSQAIVRYIVHYRTIGLDSGSLNPQTLQSQQQNLVRIPYELSTSFTGYNDSECHFRLAESQFFRMSKRSEYKVVKVELILNIALTKSYEKAKQKFIEAKKPLEEMLVFHGTDRNAIEKIVEEGFKIGGDGIPVRNGRAYGSGVYTASDASISIPYAKGLNMLLLSLALIGKEGSDYKTGGSQNIFVLDKTEYLLPKYIVHFETK
ncbi:hypothetical protein SUGI_0223310 [Cryptomeria japonica]|uniref:uncharacterized protein LOC131029170 n=1 Tax=Cryptomeria japonica TaxID=3369 RepID=UPI002408B04B|nr:uncharacterized protein LOC131029170 [Cryptomeria japonica]XP_059074115.1 uncharacterized protein LOC131029170 [Cryptomeria japonica]XP_059074116.1 uncharacterized protein LOC131029170 [Cryptomeria japonica]GLJ13963.1 hypothetical protein SUGI_0223310 [Cryptomeria japonica]